MFSVILTLLVAGVLAGLVQYFVDFKKLATPEVQASDLTEEEQINWWKKFFKEHWQIPAYIIIGIAGAALVPMFNAIVTLNGLENFEEYINCEKNCAIHKWSFLVLLGYGIVLGYSAVRLLKNVATMLLGRMTTQQSQQQSSMLSVSSRMDELQRQVSSSMYNMATQMPTSQNALNYDDDNEAQKIIAAAGPMASSNCAENSPPWENKPWRPAESLKQLLKQVNLLAPRRSKASDGLIGDISHQQRTSDHNPWVLDVTTGIVTALDITNDPANGCDCNKIAQSLQLGKDARVKYVIWNRQIMSSTIDPWQWRPYNGTNPHDKHIHVSVNCEKAFYDSVAAWSVKC